MLDTVNRQRHHYESQAMLADTNSDHMMKLRTDSSLCVHEYDYPPHSTLHSDSLQSVNDTV